MARFAADTTVPVDKSQAELRNVVLTYGASAFGHNDDMDKGISTIQFKVDDRIVRFVMELPKLNDNQFQFDKNKPPRRRTPEAAAKVWEQACRQRWRALLLSVRAKLEAVESHIATFEAEFLAYTVEPGNRTVGEIILPLLAEALEGNKHLRLTGHSKQD